MKLYIDANVYKFAATKLLRFVPRDQTVQWSGRSYVAKIHDAVYHNPSDRIQDPVLKAEAELLPTVAQLIIDGAIRGVTQVETELETWRFRNLDSDTGRFYGAKIEHCEAPIIYGRIVIGAAFDFRRMQIEFLSGLKSARFLEIQRAVGAYQGLGKFNENQLLDAFAIWCAEFNECDAMLSLDFQLARLVATDPKKRVNIPVLRPSEILKKFEKGA